jgi:hypothetical protein
MDEPARIVLPGRRALEEEALLLLCGYLTAVTPHSLGTVTPIGAREKVLFDLKEF